jgi:hypothetical protein
MTQRLRRRGLFLAAQQARVSSVSGPAGSELRGENIIPAKHRGLDAIKVRDNLPRPRRIELKAQHRGEDIYPNGIYSDLKKVSG